MRHLLLSLICLLSWSSRAAELLHIEDTTLMQLPVAVESAIRSASDVELHACRIVGRPIQVARRVKLESYVATTSNGCGWGAASASLWLVLSSKGAYVATNLESGYAVERASDVHLDRHDIVVRAGNAGHATATYWRFDGRQYRRTNSKSTNLGGL